MKQRAVRETTKQERKGRGCAYCLDMRRMSQADCVKLGIRPSGAPWKRYQRIICCTHEVCPYRELDGIKNYVKEYDEPLAQSWLWGKR